jgi:hypothetical protein
MKKPTKLLRTDSIQKLARFWDTHDLTDFEDDLEEVEARVFVRGSGKGSALNVPLKAREARAVEQLAQSKGVSPQELVRQWVVQKISPRRNGRTASTKTE